MKLDTLEIQNREYEEMKNELLTFIPDPEAENTYYTIYQNGKILGRSNREAALTRFLANVQALPKSKTQNITIQWDGDENAYEISSHGTLKDGFHGHLQLATTYIEKLFRVFF